MRWTREQYLALMTFGDFPRPMFIEPFGPLLGLDEEWRQQGATEEEIAMVAFDFDYVETTSAGGNVFAVGLPETEVIEDSETRQITRDSFGRIMELDKRTATLPLPRNFPVSTMDDWLKLKPHFLFCEDRISSDAMGRALKDRERGKLVLAHIPGAYDTLRTLMGEEMLVYACVDQPEMVHDIMTTLRELCLQVLEPITREITIDQLSVHEDMAGRSGPLLGPSQVREFIRPYYRPVWELLRERGTQIFDIDTDGNVNAIMEPLAECGINHLHPMEPAAGMDIVKSRKQFGKAWTFNGGLDKFAVMKGRAAIDKELDYKLTDQLISEGGIAFGLDHRIPNGTHIEDYRYYVKAARERLGLPPLDGQRKGWKRMAM